MHASRFARVAGPLLVALLLGACGSDSSRTDILPSPVQPVPVIITFGADRATIDAGEIVTLGWLTKDVDELALVDGTGASISLEGASLEQGSISVDLATTTTYTLTATREDTDVVSSQTFTVTVRGTAAAPPVVVEFAATPGAVTVGTPVTLSWKTTDATGVSIKDDAGQAVDLGNGGAVEGQVTVEPTRSTTTYTLTAHGPGGKATAEVSVTVSGLPLVARFDVTPFAPVDVGGAVTLTWATANATGVAIEQNGQRLDIPATELSGSRSIILDKDALFTITATNGAGTAEARAEARIGPRIEAFSSTARLVRVQDDVTFTWKIDGADGATIVGPGGLNHVIEASSLTSGSVALTMTESGDIVLRAFRNTSGGQASRTAVVAINVARIPRVRSLELRDAITASVDSPGTLKLTWAQTGADTCTIFLDGTPVPDYDGFSCAENGSAEVSIVASSTLRFEARNDEGADVVIRDVAAVPPARVVSFGASPNRRLQLIDPFRLSWTVEDAVSVSIEKDGIALSSVSPTDFDSFYDDVAGSGATYILTAKNSLEDDTVALVEVQVGAPVVISAVAEPSWVRVGDPFDLIWIVDGGTSLAVTGPGVTFTPITDEAEIDRGSHMFTAPAVIGEYTYSVKVTNSEGSGEKEVVVTASDGPVISSFTADRRAIGGGESITLSWEVLSDTSGGIPTLSLTDDRGPDYSLDPALVDWASGSLTVWPEEDGSHVFTLAAATEAGRMVHERSITVEVTNPVDLLKFVADPDRVSTSGGNVDPYVDLIWQSRDGVELWIFDADSAGNATNELHHLSAADGDQSEIDEGMFRVHPRVTRWYLIRIENRAGDRIEDRLLVMVDVPSIQATIEPEDIILGENAKLSWTSQDATGVRIDPISVGVTRLSDAYVDISTTGTLGSLSTQNSLETIFFPEGFTFPFDGMSHSAIQVSLHGWAGFDRDNESPTAAPGSLPNASNPHVQMAVYTGDGGLSSTASTPNGKLYYGMHTDDLGDCFIIQWHNWGRATAGYNPSNLNFQLVLRRSGDFEYRYGAMYTAVAARAEGLGSSIGFQYSSGSFGMNVVPDFGNTVVPGGLANTGFRFKLGQSPNGSMDVWPLKDTTYTVAPTAGDATGDGVEATVRVWPEPTITSVASVPTAPQAGDPFAVEWTTNATLVRLLDENGLEECKTTTVAEAVSGSCEVERNEPGVWWFTLEVTNGIARNVVRHRFSVTVYAPIVIHEFTANGATDSLHVASAASVTLEWRSAGASRMVLHRCTPHRNGDIASCVDITPANADPDGGTYSYNAATGYSYDFWLRLYGDGFRLADERSVVVWVDSGTISPITASAKQIAPGEAVTLSWTSSPNQTSVTFDPPSPPEVTHIAPFIDISGMPGAVAPVLQGNTGSTNPSSAKQYYTIPFPSGFTFPWFGVSRNSLLADKTGWITFDMSETSTARNTAVTIPTSTQVHIFPFWENMLPKSNGGVWYKLFDDDPAGRYLVVMWKEFEHTLSSAQPASLNFEAVLFENGNIDFRYGTMTSPNQSRSDGSAAGIGWQSPPGTNPREYQLLKSSGAVPGGLSNRSWRFARTPVSGSYTVYPAESTTYEVCSTNASLYQACSDVRVVVVKPGDLLFSELMIAPSSTDAEWIELRNMSPDVIDLEGWRLSSGGTYTIPSELKVDPGAYVVLARSGAAGNGGFEPAYVYGSQLTLADSAGDVSLEMVDQKNAYHRIDRVAWTASWRVTANSSIAMDPALMRRDESCNDAQIAWCPAATTYGNGTYYGTPGTAGASCSVP